MTHRDRLLRFLIDNTPVRGEWAHLDASWRAVIEGRDYPEPVRHLLGQSLAAGILLGATLKYEGSIILQIQSDGPVNLLVVQVTSDRTFRGMADWQDNVPDSESLRALCGDGRLVITVEMNKSGERYQSIVELGEGNLSQALDDFFARSEQLPTRLWLAADATQVAGLLLQEMPETAASPMHEDEDAWNRAVHLASTVEPQELLQLPAEELLHRLYHEEQVRLFEADPLSFRCTCSRERIEETLRGMGYDDIQGLLSEQGKVEVDCRFCKQHYEFDSVDAEQIFAADVSPDIPKTRH